MNAPQAPPPELAFLRQWLAHDLDPAQPRPTFDQQLRPAVLAGLVYQHGLPGLLYQLDQRTPLLLPGSLSEQLRQRRYSALLFGDAFQRHVQRAIQGLQQAGLTVMVLKGWVAIQRIYGGDHSLRPYADIDLLVPPAQAARAEQTLIALDYQPQAPQPWPGYIRRYRNSRAYLSPELLPAFQRPAMLGLHWGLLDTPYFERHIDLAGIFQRAEPLQLAGRQVLQPALADFLPYAFGHLALHHEYDPALLRDYEYLHLMRAAGPNLDWNQVIQKACDWRLVLPLQTMLPRLASLSPGAIPETVLAQAAALPASRAENRYHDLVVRQRTNYSLRALLAWWSLPGLLPRLGFLLETALPSPTYMRRRYGAQGPLLRLYARRYGNFVRFVKALVRRARAG